MVKLRVTTNTFSSIGIREFHPKRYAYHCFSLPPTCESKEYEYTIRLEHMNNTVPKKKRRKMAYFVSLTLTTNLVVKPKDQEENDQMQHIQ